MTKKNREAFFCCALSLSIPNGEVYTFEGKVHGHLQFPPRGDNGFGYDPIFKPNGYKKSFAELSIKVKNKISHRALAVNKLIDFIRKVKS